LIEEYVSIGNMTYLLFFGHRSPPRVPAVFFFIKILERLRALSKN
jgi:hypothetical protein